jgi:hypothetical protein
LITRMIFGEQHRSLIPSLCSFLNSPVTSTLLDPNILLSTIFSNILSLHSSMRATKFHTHTKTGKTIVLYILTFWHRSFTFRFYHTLYLKCE